MDNVGDVITVPPDGPGAISKHGGMSTLHDALKKAWDAVGERRSSAYRDQRKRFNPRTEARTDDREYGALREKRHRVDRSAGPYPSSGHHALHYFQLRGMT